LFWAEWLETPQGHARTISKRNDEKLYTRSRPNCDKDLQVVDKERKQKWKDPGSVLKDKDFHWWIYKKKKIKKNNGISEI
jgi:hypothetical protein